MTSGVHDGWTSEHLVIWTSGTIVETKFHLELRGMVSTETIWEKLRNCYDPEIPLNVVDLGLIYKVEVENEGDVIVDMTLTAQGCPSHTEISRDIKTTLLSTPGVNTARVNVVWDPPWTPHRISPEGRQKLGIEEADLPPAV